MHPSPAEQHACFVNFVSDPTDPCKPEQVRRDCDLRTDNRIMQPITHCGADHQRQLPINGPVHQRPFAEHFGGCIRSENAQVRPARFARSGRSAPDQAGQRTLQKRKLGRPAEWFRRHRNAGGQQRERNHHDLRSANCKAFAADPCPTCAHHLQQWVHRRGGKGHKARLNAAERQPYLCPSKPRWVDPKSRSVKTPVMAESF